MWVVLTVGEDGWSHVGVWAAVSSSATPVESLPMRQLGVSVAILTAILAAAFPLFAFYGHVQHGAWGVRAAGVAASLCWFGCSMALMCTVVFHRVNPVVGVLGAMFFRLGVPLVLGLVLQHNHPDLAQAGVFGTILVYYLLSLVVETILSVRLIPSQQQIFKAS